MANPNSTVTYVEPNRVFDNFTNLVGDGNVYDRAPDLEDYCISMNIGVEVSSREDGLRKQEAENRVIILSYRDNGNTSTVNFMSGTKLGCSKKENSTTETYNAFTTYPMDMYVTDLVDYGTTEMIGVKSVTVDYNSGYIPKIRIQFTDVRGMSLFQPKELNYDNSVNGIRGLSKGNIAQTFFQCFFNLPLPKFTIQIKGFYGRPVTYQVMCDSFVTNFNSATGDFDIDASFIGYGFSFMSDIAFDALISAPYSDYFGEEYWNSQVKAGRFVIPGKNNEPQDMPRLYDVRKNFETMFNESGEDFNINSLTDEEKYHTKEIEDLNILADNIKNWYEKIYDNLVKNYGKELVCLYKNGEGYDAILLLTNDEGNFQTVYEQLDDDVREATSNIYSFIEKYNESSNALGKIKNFKKFEEYKAQKVFKKEYVDVNTNEVIFDGFEPSCNLPRKKTIDMLFPNGDDKAKVRKIYNDGVKQYIYGFYIELDYTVLKSKVISLTKDSSMTDDEKTKRENRRIFNQKMFAKMTWYPTIENFTKIMMAHLETLMAMMYNVVTRVSNTGEHGRTVADLGVSLEDLTDINPNGKPEEQFIPPFPRITRLTTEEDGITKREDAWIGEFGKPGGEIPEIDMINGLFNGISAIRKLEDSIQAAKNEINKGDADLSKLPGKVKYPTTPYDLYIDKNLYGDSNDISSNIYSFIGKVALRMFDVLAINTFRYRYGAEWVSNNAENLGKVEAMNFHELTRLKSTKVFEAISEGGEFQNGDMAWNVITGNYTGMTEENCPWGGGSLFTENSGIVWLDKYKSSNEEWVYPAQDFDFKNLSEIPTLLDKGQYPIGNDDIIISDIEKPRTFLGNYLKSDKDNAFFNFFIEEDRNRFMNAYNDASSLSNEEAYSEILTNYVLKSAALDEEKINKLASIFAVSGDENTEFKPSSFVNRFEQQSGGISTTTYQKLYRLTPEALSSYLTSDSNEGIPESISLSEVFGINYNGAMRSINTSLSYFDAVDIPRPASSDSFENVYSFVDTFDEVAFLMGINGINFDGVSQSFGSKEPFVYLPKITVLQFGAILGLLVCNNWNINTQIAEENINKIGTWICLPTNFKSMIGIINTMNSFAKTYLIKYFVKWAKNNKALIKDLKKDFYVDGKLDNRDVKIFRQTRQSVKNITKDLLSIVIVVRGNVNAFKKDEKSSNVVEKGYVNGVWTVRTITKPNLASLTRWDCRFSKDDAITYLNAFLNKLRQLNNIGDENGNLTQQAKTAEKTTDDMKMELYRYLKQIYDKWIPTTDFDDWKYETFFGGKPSSEQKEGEEETPKKSKDSAGHQFHFIDSYFNKTNKKLLINPKTLSEKIATSLAYTDINVMMHTFLADVYAEHRCMLRCVQNFADLGNDELMKQMFTPIPYNEMGRPDIHPDFVIVYTYEPSKNLNIDNGEFKDDSFMLNEEMETPIAIRTRSVNNENGYYKIPAFGVSYGKQYQDYFKSVNVGMKSPIQTQQSLIAKHAILKASRDDKSSKTVTAQDLYDIYSTQSYTCDVEMMGCAWVQPMMYFVLLNIPMFRGSYMIMKVTHKITPGNMSTTFTGCRMANVGNRFIQDIFSEEDYSNENGDYTTYDREKLANIDNDCPYKVYPLIEGEGEDLSSELSKNITEDMCGNNKNIMVGKNLGDFLAQIVEREAGAGSNELQKMLVATTIYNRRSGSGGYKDKILNQPQYDVKKASQTQASEESKRIIRDIFANSPSYILGKYKKSTVTNNNLVVRSEKSGKWYKKGDKVVSSEITVEKLSVIQYFCNYQELTPGKKPNKWVENQYAVIAQDAVGSTYGHMFYADDENKSLWKAPSKNTNAEITNDNIALLLFNAVQKSLSSTNSSAGLEFAHTKEKPDIPTSPLIITQKDGGTGQLAKVFDILLNTPEYYKHVQNLCWACSSDGAQGNNPKAVVVTPVLQAVPENQLVFVADYVEQVGYISTTIDQYNFVMMEGKKAEDIVNKNLLMPLYKHFKGQADKRYRQFSADLFKEIDIANCNNIMGNGGYDTSSEIKTYVNGTIGDWNVGDSVNYLLTYAREHTSNGLDSGVCKNGAPFSPTATDPSDRRSTCEKGHCYGYVKRALKAGGINVGGESAYMAASQLPNKGFVKIAEGRGITVDYASKQLGDITVFNKCSGHEHGHITMWCGKEWVSDFKQMNNRINSKTETNYTVWRYSGKGKS